MAPSLTECRPLFSALDPHTQCTRTYANSRHNQEMVVDVQRKYSVHLGMQCAQSTMCAVFSFQSCTVCDTEMAHSAVHTLCRREDFAMRRWWWPLTPSFCHTQLAPRGTSHIILNVAHCPLSTHCTLDRHTAQHCTPNRLHT